MTWDQVLVWLILPALGTIVIGGGAVWLSRHIPPSPDCHWTTAKVIALRGWTRLHALGQPVQARKSASPLGAMRPGWVSVM
jgi:hypothetical protein